MRWNELKKNHWDFRKVIINEKEGGGRVSKGGDIGIIHSLISFSFPFTIFDIIYINISFFK